MRDSGDVFVGTAEGRGADWARLDVVARATGDAVLQAMEAPAETLSIRGAMILPTFGERAVVAAATVSYRDQKADVQGICVVRGDVVKATALAVLNAVNRFL